MWLADSEDANAPTWANMVGGQVNLVDAIERRIDDTTPEGRRYTLGDQVATIVTRPGGWHLDERHLEAGGTQLAGALVDFGLYFFHNASRQLANGSGPYFYLPKLLVRAVLDEEVAKLRQTMGEQAFAARRFEEAGKVFEQVALADEFAEFLTLPAYELLDQGR